MVLPLIINNKSLFRYVSAVVGHREGGGQHLGLLRHADGLRAYRLHARCQGDVRRTFRRVGVVLHRDGQRRLPFGTFRRREGYPLFGGLINRGAPGNPLARSGHLHALACGTLGLESQRRRVYRQRIDLRSLRTGLRNRHAHGFQIIVIFGSYPNRSGTFLGRRILGDRDQQLSGRPVVHRNPVGRRRNGIFPLHAGGGHGNLLRSRILCPESKRLGRDLEGSGLSAPVLRRTCCGEHTGRRDE